jgi:DNA invertase Pin-like site-specific DNA recombinase
MNNQPLDNQPISERHRQRLAYIYIRQSTLRQVAEHQESQELQYQLVSRAQALGWPAERIEVIDEDLGKSAVSSSGRTGFQRLFTDIGLGKAGILLVTDVSRLARNCADWYQLLDLAALRDVLVCDAGGVYNPRAYDDRLLLGVKGAFSEAQWYIMRQQLQAARLNKAKRGELALRLAIGYERLPNGQVIFTPDQQVQGVIRLVFDLFRRHGSARAVLRQLRADGLQLPRQARNPVGQPIILWGEPTYSQVYFILKLPLYAGAYAYGKRQREHLPGQPGTVYGRRLPPQEWQVLRHDQFPAYIAWEEYLANQETLAHNWQTTRFADPDALENNFGWHNPPFSYQGVAGKGRALLAGLVLCGVCGRRLRVRYADKPAYVCEATKNQLDQPRCQYLPYAHIDQAVVAAFLDAVQPAALEAALLVLEEMDSQQQALAGPWRQQLDRAHYQVELAQTRYEQVDPQLRLVAAELERAWESALQAQQHLQQEWQRLQAEQPPPLSSEDEALVRRLAHDLPALWSAETTAIPDRKRLLRLLIADVTLDGRQEKGLSHIYVRWQTGATTHLAAARPQPGHPANPALLERVRVLVAAGHNDQEIAAILNQEGMISSWHVKDDPAYVPGQPVAYWDKARVRHWRYKHKIQLNPTAGEFVAAETAAGRLGVSVSILLDWFRRGLLPGKQERRGAPVWISWDESLHYRLKGRAPRDLPFRPETTPVMVGLAEATARFGLTLPELTTALKAGRFLTWRLEHGCHYRWYLQEINPDSAEPADSLSK